MSYFKYKCGLTNIQMQIPAKEDIKRLKTTIGQVPKIALSN